MKKIISLTLCIAVILSAVLSLSGCFALMLKSEQRKEEKIRDEILNIPVNGDYTVVTSSLIKRGDKTLTIVDLVHDSNSKKYSLYNNARVVDKYAYYILKSHKQTNSTEDSKISFYDNLLLLKVNLSTLASEEIPLSNSEDLSTSTAMSNERYVIALTKKWDEERKEEVSLDNYDNVIIYDCYEETFINDSDYKKYYDDPQYQPQKETSFTDNGTTYTVSENKIINTSTAQQITIKNSHEIISYCQGLSEDDKSKFNELNYTNCVAEFFVMRNQPYVVIYDEGSMFSGPSTPSAILKYDVTNNSYFFISSIHIGDKPLLVY